MSSALQTDIVISGAGIAGLTLAACLADSELKVCVVERRLPEVQSDAPELRVSAISRASLEVFQRCGIRDALLADRATAFEQMHVWDVAGAGQIHFDSADTDMETLGYIIENSRIQRASFERISQADNIELVTGSISSIEIAAQEHSLALEDGSAISCQLLVGADGVNSMVRTSAHIDFTRQSYEQSGLVCVVATQEPHQYTAWQIFLEHGPLAFLPMFRHEQRDLCSIVWTLPTDTAQHYIDLQTDDFIGILEQAFQYRLGSLELVSERAAFPLQHGHAQEYVQQGLALIGDAAHVIHPLAGQGANLGIADAACLADVVVQAKRKGRQWSALHSLRRYERQRKGDNLLMETAMTGFNKLFSNDDQWLAMVRNAGLNMVDQAPFVKHQFMKHAMGI